MPIRIAALSFQCATDFIYKYENHDNRFQIQERVGSPVIIAERNRIILSWGKGKSKLSLEFDTTGSVWCNQTIAGIKQEPGMPGSLLTMRELTDSGKFNIVYAAAKFACAMSKR